MRIKLIITITLLGLLGLPGYSQKLILFSKASENSSYRQLFHEVDPGMILKSAYDQPKDSIESWLKRASGIVLTGGEDIHPSIYGKEDEIDKCGRFDRYRDTLELNIFQYARENKIPLLGICRGEQMMNVALGGSLYTDIPTDIYDNVTHRRLLGAASHKVKIDTLSLLYEISGVKSGTVNSYHHQCVDVPADAIEIAARAPDGVVESIIYQNNEWIALGVQWHPEKLDFEHPLAGNIAVWFVSVLE